MPRPPSARSRRRIRLDEEVEDARQHVGADADAGVADADHRVGIVALDHDRHVAARGRVLRGVAEEVLEHLAEAHRVARHRQRRARHPDFEPVPARGHRRAAHVCCVADDRGDVEPLALERDLPCVTRDTSSRSSTMRVIRRAWRAMISSGRRASGDGIWRSSAATE